MHYRYIPESDPITVETYSSVACLPIPETGFQLANAVGIRYQSSYLHYSITDSVLISSTFLVAIHVPELDDLDRTVIDSTFFRGRIYFVISLSHRSHHAQRLKLLRILRRETLLGVRVT